MIHHKIKRIELFQMKLGRHRSKKEKSHKTENKMNTKINYKLLKLMISINKNTLTEMPQPNLGIQ